MIPTKEAALEWLSLVESSGVQLAPKVLEAAFPQSLDTVDTAGRRRLRSAWEEWRDAVDARDPRLPDLHREWIRMVLGELLEYRPTLLHPVAADDTDWARTAPDTGTITRPDWLLRTAQDRPKAAVFVYPPGTALDRAVKGDVSLLDRAATWCRAAGVRNALLTDGERWTLVDAPEGALSGSVSWYARLWWLEPVTLRAFYSLLRARRLFGPQESTFPQLVDDSLDYRDEVTTTLGRQVERAVEVLVRALDRADRDRRGELLDGVSASELYEAGLTVMMRLVFVLSAEERGLLLLGDPVWDANYAVSTLRAQLEETDDRDGHGVLQRRLDAWNRLLAVFRAVYGGIEHEGLRLPALGGSLFDPDRFPFLEGRPAGSSWRDTPARPLPIDNRTVLLLLNALQKLAKRDGAQFLSYRALDVEQIGHVYEGLLDRTVARMPTVTLGLEGAAKKSPDVALTTLESALFDGRDRLVAVLKEVTGRSEASIRRDLDKDVAPDTLRALDQACDGDRELVRAILPFANLLRTDPWDEPVVYREGAFAVVSGSDRSNTGAHYTPRALTEKIVGTTLEPVVYIGPAEGLPREDWRLKSAAELLDLKICDPAMGSGAFLVQVCRWLAEKVVQAWAAAEERGEAVTAEGDVVATLGGNDPLPTDPEERFGLARRLVAERCLYGVDINPVAVELAKLSIWLVTLAKNRPFGFLDHNLRHGDSLLGIRDLDQLTSLSMTPKPGDQQYIFATNIRKAVDEAVKLRQQLRAVPIRDIRDVQQMAKLDEQARRILERPELAADALIGEAMRHAGRPNDLSVALRVASTEIGKMINGDVEGEEAVTKRAREALAADLPSGKNPRKTMHWHLEFPEVFQRVDGGFDAIVGNPPFAFGKDVSAGAGSRYSQYLVNINPQTTKNVDLCVHFLLMGAQLMNRIGALGILATSSIAEGESRLGGLKHVIDKGGTIYSANSKSKWPGKANVYYCIVNITFAKWKSRAILNEVPVQEIDSFLGGSSTWESVRLIENIDKAFIGVIPNGDGFFIDYSEAHRLLRDHRHIAYVKPFLVGRDLNSSPDQRPQRYAIDVSDLNLGELQALPELMHIIESRVKPHRENIKYKKPKLFDRWWSYEANAKNLYAQIDIKSISEVLAISRVSSSASFAFVDAKSIFDNAVVVMPTESRSAFAVLQSNIHLSHAWKYGGRMKSDLRYSPTMCFATFPFPIGYEDSPTLQESGKSLESIRREYMNTHEVGLTKTLSAVNDSENNSYDITRLREAIIENDYLVLESYGWSDISLDHGFYIPQYLSDTNRQRFFISHGAYETIIHRLETLNKDRHFKSHRKTQGGATASLKEVKASGFSDIAVPPAPLFDPAPAAGLAPEKPKQAVLEVLRGGNRWFKKAQVLQASGITEAEWNQVIAELVADGTVERRGEKRGTEYMLKR